MVSLAASHLELLQVPARLSVLRRLWPLIALLQSPSDRMTAFANCWRAALALHLDARTAALTGGSGLAAAGLQKGAAQAPGSKAQAVGHVGLGG